MKTLFSKACYNRLFHFFFLIYSFESLFTLFLQTLFTISLESLFESWFSIFFFCNHFSKITFDSYFV